MYTAASPVTPERWNPTIDRGNIYFGGQEVMTIFNDVFVPGSAVFMDGETDFTTMVGAFSSRVLPSELRRMQGRCW